MSVQSLRRQVRQAIAACQDKKAEDLAVLELGKHSGAFTDYFVICSGANPRQIQAIADAVGEQLGKMGLLALHVEGYTQAEWVLLDYVDLVVHIFSEKARKFYDLERLWRSAKRLDPGTLKAPAAKTEAAPRPRTARAKRPRRKS
jgi:ribosome-associated protein